jgi:hypothetical protein
MEERLDHKIISAIEHMPSKSRPNLRTCLEGLIEALVPFDIAPLGLESFEDKYWLAPPWIPGKAGKIHALCSTPSFMLPSEKGAEHTRYLLVSLSEITPLIHKLWSPVDSKVGIKD